MTPETITIPASLTVPKANFDAFVERLGYFTEIEDPNDNTQMIPNPETKIDFAQRVFKEDVVLPFLLQFIYNDIDVAINNVREEERRQKKQAAHDVMSQAVTVG